MSDAGRGLGVLDRSAPTPLYFQLREALLAEIKDRGLEPGDRLPTEAAIERRYGVSRATIRQALAELASEGVIRRVQGLGTFVARPKIQHVPLLTSFSELVTSQGFVPSHRLLASETVPAPAEAAADLGIPERTACRFLRRLMLADGKVVGLAETWLPQDIVGDHADLFEPSRLGAGSLYELLQSTPLSVDLDHAVETISPNVADPRIAGLLGCETGSPVLVLRRRSFTAGGRAVESTLLFFVGERYEYRVELRRPGTVPGRMRMSGAPDALEVRALVASVVARLANGPPGPGAPEAARADAGAADTGGGTSSDVAVGADHGGFVLKERIRTRVGRARLLGPGPGHERAGVGRLPGLRARRARRAVAGGAAKWGIVVDGAGIGSCIAANKVPGIRAATCWDISSARNSREHNHANVLCLGAGLIGEALAMQIVQAWLATPWGGDRHARRVEKITQIERTLPGPHGSAK